jgi:abortive infection bacteriophage resistance protein
MKFTKPPISLQEQLILLKNRGLIISGGDERALSYLSTIGYYRLTGYMYHLQKRDGTHEFKTNTTFDEVLNTYNFDKKLRYLVGAYLERIEVALRARITDVYSIKYGFYWYTDPSHYVLLEPPASGKDVVNRRKYLDTHKEIISEVKRYYNNEYELFIQKFKLTYVSENTLPCNMAMQVLSMGKLSRLYEALQNTDERKEVSEIFGFPFIYLSTWFTYLTNIRNICAHHGRLWNRRATADRFKVPSRKEFKFNGEISDNFNTTFYGTLTIMIKLLSTINPQNNFLEKFMKLVDEYPVIDLHYMGFPEKWHENPAWK